MSSSEESLTFKPESIPQGPTLDFRKEIGQKDRQNHLQPLEVEQSTGGRRYSLKTSGERPLAAPNPTNRTNLGVFAVSGIQQNSRTVHRETPREQRERLIRNLRLELCKAHDTDASPYATAPEASVNFELDENQERGNWSGRLDFLLSCLGYAVGLGNVWRFPYLCFMHGGGAFLIPYTIFLLLCGIPVFLLDLSLGQFTNEGPATCWEFAPILSGVGYAMTYLSTMVAIYYNMIMAYSIYYLFASMTSTLPWSGCDNSWNTPRCSALYPTIWCSEQGKQPNGTCYNGTNLLGVYNETLFEQTTTIKKVLPAEEYFTVQVLKASISIDDFGRPDWKLALCLLAAWILVFVCMLQGIKSTGKVVYFTALFPYVILVVLFLRGITLSNAVNGIKFYIVPSFAELAEPAVWKDAAGQIFFSLSCSNGGLTSLASYNRFHNNVIKDTLIVAIANCVTSVFAGFVVFSFLGHLAGSLGVDVKDVTKSESGLAFIVYPEAIRTLPGSAFWAMLFFVMLLFLGVDSQFAMVETLIAALCDKVKSLRNRKPFVIGLVCASLFLLGLPFTCRGGFYLMNISDRYAGTWAVLLLGLIECVAIGWLYGRPGLGRFHRFSIDIGLMMRRSIWSGWRYLWQFVTPLLLAGIIIFNWAVYERTKYSNGEFYPLWAEALGWLIALISVLIILLTALVKLLMEPKESPWSERIFNLSIPSYKWGPALPRHRMLMTPYMDQLHALEHFYLSPKKLIKFNEVFPKASGGHNATETATDGESEEILATRRGNRNEPAVVLDLALTVAIRFFLVMENASRYKCSKLQDPTTSNGDANPAF